MNVKYILFKPFCKSFSNQIEKKLVFMFSETLSISKLRPLNFRLGQFLPQTFAQNPIKKATGYPAAFYIFALAPGLEPGTL
jgi:hypothetical protein